MLSSQAPAFRHGHAVLLAVLLLTLFSRLGLALVCYEGNNSSKTAQTCEPPNACFLSGPASSTSDSIPTLYTCSSMSRNQQLPFAVEYNSNGEYVIEYWCDDDECNESEYKGAWSDGTGTSRTNSQCNTGLPNSRCTGTKKESCCDEKDGCIYSKFVPHPDAKILLKVTSAINNSFTNTTTCHHHRSD